MKKICAIITIIIISLSICHGYFPFSNAQESPVADFTYIIDGYNVTFNASISYDPDGMINTYYWDFGDNVTAVGVTQFHHYIYEGVFQVTLTVTDDDSNANTSRYNIYIDMSPPITKMKPFPENINGMNNWYISPLVIDFVSYDNISGVNEIRYKINGNNFKTYSHPIKLTENNKYTIQYYAIDNSNNVENITYFNINIDYFPPFTQLYTSKASSYGWFKNSVNIGLETQDNLSGIKDIYYRINGGMYESYSGDLSFHQGHHVLEYFAIDNAGNAEHLNRFEVNVDSTPPYIEFIQSGGTYLFERKIFTSDSTIIIGSIQLEVVSFDNESGIKKVEFFIDNSKQADDITPPYDWNWDDFSVGIHTVKIISYDFSGNSVQITKEVLFINLKLD